jgi:hypothetical protein
MDEDYWYEAVENALVKARLYGTFEQIMSIAQDMMAASEMTPNRDTESGDSRTLDKKGHEK